MNHLPYQNRKLTEEAAFCDVPKVNTSVGELVSDYETGEVWTRYFVHSDLGEYLMFLDQVEKTDWKPYFVHREPIRKKVYTAFFTKDDRYLDISFYNFDGDFLPPKLFVSVGLLPECFFEDVTALTADVPEMEEEKNRPAEYVPKGDRNYLKVIGDVSPEGVWAYIEKAEAAGFVKTSDEPSVIDGRIYTLHLRKDDRILTVTYISPLRQIRLTVGRGNAISPYLTKPEKPDVVPGEKTSLHLLEMWFFGTSIVIRLKNGHFLIQDGGLRCETPYLLDYLDSLTPEGEIPVVEGWFISHAHADHSGVLIEMALDPQWKDRVKVEGIYFNEPPMCLYSVDGSAIGATALFRMVQKNLRTMKGEPTPFYRPMLGDRFYFSDVTIDVIMTQDLVEYEQYSGDLNDTTTWFLARIEGQSVLLGGDGDKSGIKFIMTVFPAEHMKFDVMSVLHHGFNTNNEFTNFCSVKTALFNCYGEGPKIRSGAKAPWC